MLRRNFHTKPLVAGMFCLGFMATGFVSLGFCQSAAPDFTLENLRGGQVTLSDSYNTAKTILLFFWRFSSATEETGTQLVQHLEGEYNRSWQKLPGKVLVILHGENPQGFQNEITTLPVLLGTDQVLTAYQIGRSGFSLCIIHVGAQGGMITGRFEQTATIMSNQVNIAVQRDRVEPLIKADFNNASHSTVFERIPDSAIVRRGQIDYSFDNQNQIGGEGYSCKIIAGSEQSGSFEVELAGYNLSQASHLVFWVRGGSGEEQFDVGIKDLNRVEHTVKVENYIRTQSLWQRVNIPLKDFNDSERVRQVTPAGGFSQLNLSQVDRIGLRFNSTDGVTVYVDDISFERTVGTAVGQPALGIEITTAPPRGGGPNQMEEIAGRVTGLTDPNDYRLVIYSGVYSLRTWYVQPYETMRHTAINPDGTWSTFIHLGDEYAVLLVEQSYQPPAQVHSRPREGGQILKMATATPRR
jgi:hypothetical protein